MGVLGGEDPRIPGTHFRMRCRAVWVPSKQKIITEILDCSQFLRLLLYVIVRFNTCYHVHQNNRSHRPPKRSAGPIPRFCSCWPLNVRAETPTCNKTAAESCFALSRRLAMPPGQHKMGHPAMPSARHRLNFNCIKTHCFCLCIEVEYLRLGWFC